MLDFKSHKWPSLLTTYKSPSNCVLLNQATRNPSSSLTYPKLLYQEAVRWEKAATQHVALRPPSDQPAPVKEGGLLQQSSKGSRSHPKCHLSGFLHCRCCLIRMNPYKFQPTNPNPSHLTKNNNPKPKGKRKKINGFQTSYRLTHSQLFPAASACNHSSVGSTSFLVSPCHGERASSEWHKMEDDFKDASFTMLDSVTNSTNYSFYLLS